MELSKNAQKVFDLIKDLSAVELSSLVSELEEEFGVSAAAAAVAGAPAQGGGGDEGGEKDSFSVELEEIGQKKIAVIKVVKEVCGLGLKEAKAKVEESPVVLKEDVKTDDAEAMKEKLEEAGAKVNLK